MEVIICPKGRTPQRTDDNFGFADMLFGKLRGDLAHENIQVRLSLSDAYVRLEMANAEKPGRAALVQEKIGSIHAIEISHHCERNPQIVVQPSLGPYESLWRYANDLKWMAINLDSLTDDGRIGAKMRLPELMADDDDGSTARLSVFRGKEAPAENWTNA